jgi:hypothetical protein
MNFIFNLNAFSWKPMQPTALAGTMTKSQHVYEIRPRKDHRGVDLISDALPFGRLWYAGPNAATNAVSYAKFYSRCRGLSPSRYAYLALHPEAISEGRG